LEALSAGQCLARGIVPGASGRIRGIFGQFSWGLRNRLRRTSVSYSGTADAAKFRTLDPIPQNAGDTAMVITAAHVPAIVALIAGILILIMPRLLNFIVAIYLIFVGLVGMGLLKWLHM
jgi:Protein of unknown function (DUF3096)